MASDAASLYSGGRDTRNALWGRKPVATRLKHPFLAHFPEVATAEIPSRADFMERPSLPAIWRFRQHGPPRQYGAPGGLADGAPIHRFRAAPSRDNHAVGLRFNCQHVPPFLHLIPEQGGVLFPSLSSRYWAAPMWRAIWDARRPGLLGKPIRPDRDARSASWAFQGGRSGG